MRKLKNLLAGGALTATAVLGVTALTSTPAQAGPAGWWLRLGTTHHVGIYKLADSWSSKIGPDLSPLIPDAVHSDCYTHGENINGQGDIWYHINEYSYGFQNYSTWGYAYAPYVNDNWNVDNPVPWCGY